MQYNTHKRGVKGAVRNENGLSEIQQQFLDWYCDPEREGTIDQWAKEHDISTRAIRHWRSGRDLLFMREWQRKLTQLNLGPDRVQQVINSVFKKAVDGDMPAANLYLKYVEKMSPDVEVGGMPTRQLGEMSNDELIQHARAIEAKAKLKGG